MVWEGEGDIWCERRRRTYRVRGGGGHGVRGEGGIWCERRGIYGGGGGHMV